MMLEISDGLLWLDKLAYFSSYGKDLLFLCKQIGKPLIGRPILLTALLGRTRLGSEISSAPMTSVTIIYAYKVGTSFRCARILYLIDRSFTGICSCGLLCDCCASY